MHYQRCTYNTNSLEHKCKGDNDAKESYDDIRFNIHKLQFHTINSDNKYELITS